MKHITYFCDVCGNERPLEELKATAAYVYDDNLADPKILDMEHVCPGCRSNFVHQVYGYVGSKEKT